MTAKSCFSAAVFLLIGSTGQRPQYLFACERTVLSDARSIGCRPAGQHAERRNRESRAKTLRRVWRSAPIRKHGRREAGIWPVMLLQRIK